MMNINEKGITIITLIITVLLLIIITGTLAINTYNSIELSKLVMLENDIKTLESRVASYFVENDELPTYDYTYTKTELQNVMDDLSDNDGENYYIIDLTKLDNITLNYNADTDVYIVNEISHNIYYLGGISYNGDIFHTAGKKNENIVVIH